MHMCTYLTSLCAFTDNQSVNYSWMVKTARNEIALNSGLTGLEPLSKSKLMWRAGRENHHIL